MNQNPLILERILDADAAAVWTALTRIDQMKQWFFPMMDAFEPKVGFSTTFDVTHNDKTYPHMILVTQAIWQQRIAYSWKYGGYPGNSIISFAIEPLGKQTRLLLTHDITESFEADRYPDFSSENFKIGWTHFADSLKIFVESKI